MIRSFPVGAREYAFWLNDSLTFLAEATQELMALYRVLTPISVRIRDTDETLPDNETRRLLNALNRVLGLRDGAVAYLPPPDYDWEWEGWQHEMHVAFLHRYAGAVTAMLAAFGQGDVAACSSALLRVTELSTTAGELHSVVMERILESLPPTQRRDAERRMRRATVNPPQHDYRPPDDWSESGSSP